MGFFEEIYGSWAEMQDRKYESLFSLLESLGISGKCSGMAAVDVGSGRKREYPFPVTRVDVNPELEPDVLASGRALPFPDRVFRLAISVDACHLFGMSELFRVAEFVAISLPVRLYGRVVRNGKPPGRLIDERVLDGREKEIVAVWKSGWKP